jgi:hypothetical protein
MSSQIILDVPANRLYFADGYETDYGYFQDLDALLIYANENPDEVTGYRDVCVINFVADNEKGILMLWQDQACEDGECACSAETEYLRRRKAGEPELPSYDFDSFPRNPEDCVRTHNLTEDYKVIEIGIVVRH